MTPTTEHDELADAPFRLGEWLVEPRLNRLTRGGESIQIELKMMDVLVCLAGHTGELVTRQELIDTVWAIEFITEKTLTRAVAELRRTLGDDAREPTYIETIHRKGYRLIAPVEPVTKPSGTVTQFPGAHTATDDRNPYPGLAAFTEADAELFFGREAEVSRLWRTITTRRLLAVIGPSGVGKTSFLRAGLIPAVPEGWGILICTPGEAPFAALARALVPEISDDPEAVSKLVDFELNGPHLFGRWRERHARALLVVDQFEELFMQNPPEVQAGFAALIGRLARDADVHVLLSMRDDFLYRCHDHEDLLPVFNGLTPVKALGRDDLRRAHVQPATRFGYSFEDEALVDEMLDAVAGERGALPLLAFAVAWLWEKRDRERKLLTRPAYSDIGGVAGALAHHAESTLERIGTDRLPVVRELFRNLVTAEGTRAAREWNDLLSIFSNSPSESPSESPAAVLSALIDARLLTSYEIREGDDAPTRRVEIIHESLLANWPRLVRWQTQDADAAQLRDQLRQAAKTWDEHDRSDDLLWTGSAFRECAVWRERYAGGLTDTEEAFSVAMTGHARRRKRLRRIAVAAAFGVLLAVLGVVGVSRQQAIAESRRAEAAYVFSLAQLQLRQHPTAAIAYAMASLELSDNPELRKFIVDALWRGPTEFRLSTASPYSLDFSPDGKWLATADLEGGGKLWPSDGGPPKVLEGSKTAMYIRFSPRGDLVAGTTDTEERELGLWSVPEGRFVRSLAPGGHAATEFFRFSFDGQRLITVSEPPPGDPHQRVVQSWPVAGGTPDTIATLPMARSTGPMSPDIDPMLSRIAWPEGRLVHIASLRGMSLDGSSESVAGHDRAIAFQVLDERGLQIASSDQAGEIRVWSLQCDPPQLTHTFGGQGGYSAHRLLFDPSGTLLAGAGFLWDLNWPESEPLRIRESFALAFSPSGGWLAAGDGSVSLWPLSHAYPRAFREHEAAVTGLAFTPDCARMISTSEDGSVRMWPLSAGLSHRSQEIFRFEETSDLPSRLAMAPDGSFVVLGAPSGRLIVLPLDGAPARELHGFSDACRSLAIGPGSRLVAAGSGRYIREEAVVRVWDLVSGQVRILDAGDGKECYKLGFAKDGALWAASGSDLRFAAVAGHWVASRSTLRRWRLDADPPRVKFETDLTMPDVAEVIFDDLNADGRHVLLGSFDGRLWTKDLSTGAITELRSHAGRSDWASFDSSGELVISTDLRGARVGPITGEEPHLLPVSGGGIYAVALSSDGRWVATGSYDGTIHLWPMPDLTKPPLHTLPRQELIAKLKTLTNLQVVRDEESSTGWSIEVGPFPGWETVPTW